MNLFQSQARRPMNRFVPCLEALEDRTVLSATYGVANGVLTINMWDTIGQDLSILDIFDKGTAAGISLSIDGAAPKQIAQAITTIQINGSTSDDLISYGLIDDLQVKRTVRADLKAGTNYFSAYNDPTGSISVPANLYNGLTLWVSGGYDKDYISVGMNGAIASNASLTAILLGNNGNDTINFRYTGEMDGKIFLYADGGDHIDKVYADLTFYSGSTGYLAGLNNYGGTSLTSPAWVRGGKGDDVLEFRVHNNGAAKVLAKITGDGGFDTGKRTSNIFSSADLEVDVMV